MKLIVSDKKKRDVVEQLLLDNYNKYYRLACSYVHNDADAGDIVQNGAYKAILNSNKLKSIEYAQTWVYRIMMNKILQSTGKKKPLHWKTFLLNGAKKMSMRILI